jgi:predicted nucleotidyltransferase
MSSTRIDWRRHFDAIAGEIDRTNAMMAAAASAASLEDSADRMTGRFASAGLRHIALRMRSRHIPPVERVPGPIPWKAVSRWVTAADKADAGPWIGYDGDEDSRRIGLQMLAADFMRSIAPGLTESFMDIRDRLEAADADGSDRGAFLYVEERGSFTHATVRMPAGRMDDLRRFLASCYEDRSPPTVEGVKAALTALDKELAGLRIEEAWLYGSVARGQAGPASDIDLKIIVEVGATHRRWDIWDRTATLLEDALGAVVDLHLADRGEKLPSGAVMIWKAEG